MLCIQTSKNVLSARKTSILRGRQGSCCCQRTESWKYFRLNELHSKYQPESATAEKSEAQPGNPSRGYGQLVQPVDISQESESSKGGNFANPE